MLISVFMLMSALRLILVLRLVLVSVFVLRLTTPYTVTVRLVLVCRS